jgi:hypothetical protein
MARTTAWMAAAMLALATAARAQQPSPTAPPGTKPTVPTSQDPPSDLLRGPKIGDRATEPSLVKFDYNGRLRTLDDAPEEEAFHLLKLDDESKAKVEQILASRAKMLDRVVAENVELLVKLHNAKQSGDKAEMVAVLGEFRPKLQGQMARGPLKKEIADALPTDASEQFTRLVDAYAHALIEDDLKDEPSGTQSSPKARARVAMRELLQGLGRDIRKSYERQLGAAAADFNKLLADLDLRPDQEQKVRVMAQEFGSKTKYNATPQQKRDFLLQILPVLDQEQREKLLKRVLGKE